MRFLVPVFLLTAGLAAAGESAVLANGGRLHAERHEMDGSRVRLYNATGYIEIQADQVVRFEKDEAVAPASAPAPPAAAPVPAAPRQLADAAADKYGLPRSLVRSVMAAESGFQPAARSPKGAVGLMQLMPSTARDLGANPEDPAQNVDAGARYLRDLLEKYHGGLRHALAAYNAGPQAVDKYQGVPPYPETIDYVGKVERNFEKSAGPSPSAP
ncbi:MAG TPA: lytic transglycosylase domain-containing protein [Bryobacteraceae bacterium]|nr:lytic transglycosylase domain-containing protein [Bryobacteraceae bacterium]